MSAPRSLILFDIDGTLLKTSGAGMRAMRRVTSKLFGDSFTWDGVTVSGHLDPLIFAELTSANGIDNVGALHDTFRDQYLDHLSQELDAAGNEVYPLPGVHETLDLLRQHTGDPRAVTLGLLTGNYTRAVPMKLGAVGIDPDWFEVTAFGDEAATRADLVTLAMEKYLGIADRAIEPQRVVVIGDTPRDIAAAHAHGCVALSVATGPYTAEQLREAGSDIVVEDLTDSSVVFDLIDPDRCLTGRA